MTPAARPLLVISAMGLLLAACGGEEKDLAAAKPDAGPTYVESDACRSAATSLLDDADSGAASTDPDEIQRYLGAVQAVASGLECSPNLDSATDLVVSWLTGYQKAWARCELAGQFVDLDGDGEPDGTGSCIDADRPFAEVQEKIAAARTLVDLKD